MKLKNKSSQLLHLPLPSGKCIALPAGIAVDAPREVVDALRKAAAADRALAALLAKVEVEAPPEQPKPPEPKAAEKAADKAPEKAPEKAKREG